MFCSQQLLMPAKLGKQDRSTEHLRCQYDEETKAYPCLPVKGGVRYGVKEEKKQDGNRIRPRRKNGNRRRGQNNRRRGQQGNRKNKRKNQEQN